MRRDNDSLTDRQIEAYRLVYIHQQTQAQAGKLMGIKQAAVSRLLLRLKKNNPKIFTTKNLHTTQKRPLPFNEARDSTAKIQF